MASDISDALRSGVADRAGGRCEYCLIRQEDAAFPLQTDHIVSRKHGGESTVANLALACVLCNRLYNPRRREWSAHFRFEGPEIVSLSPTGAATIRLLRLNAPERVEGRRILQELLRYPR